MAPIPQQHSDSTLGAPGGQDPATTTTDAALTANLVCRIILALVANLVCIVPLRLLWRHGEFSATVFLLTVLALNFDTVVMALIWRDDNLAAWWPGYGLCDAHNYYFVAMTSLYASSILAIVRNLAMQVGSLRASPLTGQERRRRNLVQALIMFPIPIMQMAWIYPVSASRYLVGTLVGCAFRADRSWPTVLFFHLPNPILAVGAAYYAVLTYVRYDEIRKTIGPALQSGSMSNSVAAARSNRAQRKLYLMSLSILIPYLPIILAFLVLGLLDSFPLEPYDFGRIHYGNNPYPWDTILFVPSTEINFTYMNSVYIPIITAIPIFWFFGRTTEAMNMYRRGLLATGLGRYFPTLHEEYDPDRRRMGTGSNGSSGSSRVWRSRAMALSWAGKTTKRQSVLSNSTRKLSTPSHSSGTRSPGLPSPTSPTRSPTVVFMAERPGTASNPIDSTAVATMNSNQAQRDPASSDSHVLNIKRGIPYPSALQVPHRSPFLTRLHLDLPFPLQMPSLSSFRKKSNGGDGNADKNEKQAGGGPPSLHRAGAVSSSHNRPGVITETPMSPCFSLNPSSAQVRTHVWSEDDTNRTEQKPGIGVMSSAEVVVETQIDTLRGSPLTTECGHVGVNLQ